jgi:hypothetical protein
LFTSEKVINNKVFISKISNMVMGRGVFFVQGISGKKGLSGIITTMLLVMISLVIISIIWIVLRGFIEYNAEASGIKAKLLSERVDFRGVQVDAGNNLSLNVSLQKLSGSLEVSGEIVVPGVTSDVDIVSVVDLSATMASGVGGGETRLSLEKQANKELINEIFLPGSSSRIGLFPYNSSFIPSYFLGLTNNNASLNSKIDSWTAVGGTCICCGIINATKELRDNSPSSKTKAMIVMSDGEANVACYPECLIDGTRELGIETCEGSNLGGKTCANIGFSGGALGCTSSCELNTSSCTGYSTSSCGNGIVNFGNETCDGTNFTTFTFGTWSCSNFGYPGGSLGCTSTCQINTSTCQRNAPFPSLEGPDKRSSLDAIRAACEASSIENLVIYSVGMSSGVADNSTLINISNCGGGEYYYVEEGNITGLTNIYRIIANSVTQLTSSKHGFSFLRFVFYDPYGSAVIDKDIPNILETKKYSFDLAGTGLVGPIKRIEIYPVAITSSGQEVVGNMLDLWESNG